MAEYKAVNAEQLDADMALVADAIRERGGTTVPLAWPDGFKSAVEAVPDYMAQRLTNTLKVYYTDKIKHINNYAFYEITSLEELILPTAEHTGYASMTNCRALKNVYFPKVHTISDTSLKNTTALTYVDLPICKEIKQNGFNGGGIKTLVLRKTSGMCVLSNVNAFANSPIASGNGYVYVPRAFLSDTDSTNDYRRATNWSTYAAQFRVLEDWTVDGTTTGEMDWDKINAAEV